MIARKARPRRCLRSYGDVHQLTGGLVTRLQAEGDRLGNVRQCFFTRFALRDATGKNWALGHDPPVFAGSQDDG
jgi:hypothetical protein